MGQELAYFKICGSFKRELNTDCVYTEQIHRISLTGSEGI